MRKETHVRLGVVGGRRGGAFNLALGALRDKVTLTAVCDLSQEVLARWKSEHPEVKTYTSFAEMLSSDACNAVFVATPYPLHADQAVEALRAGKHVISEVLAASTLEQCRALVRAVEETGLTYMMAENYCYMRSNMMVANLAAQGKFGEIVYCEGAYIHDCRALMVRKDGELTWRSDVRIGFNGNTYPTHSLGPVAQWLGINRGDSLATVSCWMTPCRAPYDYVKRNFGESHPVVRNRSYTCGDSATTVLRTARGAVVVLRVDWVSARPHNMTHYALQGTRGAYLSARREGEENLVWIDGRSPADPDGIARSWENMAAYGEEFDHPRWKKWGQIAKEAGHGGGDFFVLEDFVLSVTEGTRPPIDVYDAVTWSSVMPLSAESERLGGTPVAVPGFRAKG